ncbi:Gfo/Idh/MocA family oxidoreductase [Paenibacillus chondroitinus]|uniref:Gfo/Idh/MocA family oxidoreductase n=1 Tax=Paenibacillus chondroitinus TaxID=59842 RepID=A0ABU6DCW8_9BACL|nr:MULTISPECIES: Gfo/Idh/MocA family oxidoreductase [Paenibacillus]MCY9662962.1 Gfo/Idh/MocA family oxidoreductase [Paenibacillus anseongense]MEB4795583.1 Gfo/Idh/MocA family oxidoreductase [Paenibacillus chondroitinus]
MHKRKIGMISFAHLHAVSYLEALVRRDDVELVGIADENRERVEPFIRKYQLPYYADYRELLAGDVEAVIISSENANHAEMTIEAAKHKKHVLCEKPLGVSREQMRQMIEACQAGGVQLMTSFPNRYIPMIVEAKRAIERGEIGEVIAVKATNKGEMIGGWFNDRSLSGGGSLMDHTVHVMDLLNWIFQSQAVEVYAQADSLFHGIDMDDAAMVHVKFANGVIAALDASWSRKHAAPYKRDLTMTFIGTEGVISMDYFAQVNEIYSETTGHAEWSYWGDNKDEMLIDDWIQCLKEDRPVSITGEDGYNSTVIALAAYESIRLNKPVRL